MAVQGPKVGSSAKAETGKSSMKEAGAVLGLGTPFKMSQMIGRGGSSTLIFRNSSTTIIENGAYNYYDGWDTTIPIGTLVSGNVNMNGSTIKAVAHVGSERTGFDAENIYMKVDKQIAGVNKVKLTFTTPNIPSVQFILDWTTSAFGYLVYIDEDEPIIREFYRGNIDMKVVIETL